MESILHPRKERIFGALLLPFSISSRQFCLILKTTARIPFFGSSCKCEESARTVERNCPGAPGELHLPGEEVSPYILPAGLCLGGQINGSLVKCRGRHAENDERRTQGNFASSLGTVFEWYDFYLYGTLAAFIGAAFFNEYPEATRNIFVLLAFAAGFLVRPFGALVFGRIGDLVGRKYTFLVTIVIMGASTFLVGILPGSATLGIFAPIILIVLRMLQGLALGGEYGGAATYVAEHAPNNRRGFFTS